jgi:molybdopterin converting factor small subunit
VPVVVLYFGGARDAAGTGREVLTDTPPTVGALRRALEAAHPALARVLARSRLAIDLEFAPDDAPLRDGVEVAVVPPVAGGAGLFRVVDRPLALAEVLEAVAGAGRGGIVTFTGIVRDETRGRRVLRLEYEAYVPMAERKLAAIAGARRRGGHRPPGGRARAGRCGGGDRLRRAPPHSRLPRVRGVHRGAQEGRAHLEARGLRGRLGVGRPRAVTLYTRAPRRVA